MKKCLGAFLLVSGAAGAKVKTCDLREILPLQLSVGARQVQKKISQINKQGLKKYQKDPDHHLRIIRGPAHRGFDLYLLDGHHDAQAYSAYFQSRKSEKARSFRVPCKEVTEGASRAGEDFVAFTDRLAARGQIWLFDAQGRVLSRQEFRDRIPTSQDPTPVAALADDDCRSFVYFARKYFEKKCGENILYTRLDMPFQEFHYANFVRTLKSKDFGGCASDKAEDYEYFRRNLSSELPGYRPQGSRPCGA